MSAAPHQHDLATAPERPDPPRRWWLKRGLLALGLLVGSAVPGWFAWSCEAERRLQAKLTEYRARGEPVTVEDINRREHTPEEENAAYYWGQAWQSWFEPRSTNYTSKPPMVPTTLLELGEISSDWPLNVDDAGCELDANAEALAMVRRAATCERVEWSYRLTSPLLDMATIPYWLASALVQAKRLSAAARIEARSWNLEVALEHVGSLLCLADDTAGPPPLEINHWRSCNLIERASQTIETLLPMPAAAAPTTEARRMLVEISRRLLDEPSHERIRLATIAAERVHLVDSFDYAGDMFASRGLRPLVTLDAVHSLSEFDQVVDLADRPASVQQSIARLAEERERGYSPVAREFGSIFLRGLEDTVRWPARATAERRMAGVAIAIRLFEYDHGVRPADLQELVPDYLADIPIDPFSEPAAPLGYYPDAQPARLATRAADLLDDGGEYVLNSNGFPDFSVGDYPFFLDSTAGMFGKPPTSRPTTPPP